MKYRFLLLPAILLLILSACSHQGFLLSKKKAIPDTFDLVILSTTDLHGNIMPWDYYRDQPDGRAGLVKIATLVDSVRALNPYTILVDNGDWLQGSPMAEYFATVDTTLPDPFIQAAGFIGYDAITLGNHEFDFSLELIDKRVKESAVPVVCANMYHHNTNDPYYKPYVIKSLGRFNIGILGLNTPGTAIWNKGRLDNKIDMTAGTGAAKRFIPQMLEDGADIIVVLAHTGMDGESSYKADEKNEENFGRQLAQTVPGIDYIILGHHHRIIENMTTQGPDGREVGLIMPGSRGSHLGVSTLNINKDKTQKKWLITSQKSRAIPVTHAAPHAGLTELMQDAHEKVRMHFNQAIANTSFRWSATAARTEDTPIIDLIQHVQKKWTGAQLSAAAAFNTRVEFGPGNISIANIAQLYPYENKLVLMELTGAQIRAYLEYTSQYFLQTEPGKPAKVNAQWPGFNFDMISGVNYTLNLTNPVGQRVEKLDFDGKQVQDNDVFTMAVNSYRAAGGGGFDMLKDAKIIREYDVSVRSILVDFLRANPEIEPEQVFEKNWTLITD